ncbi:AAA family ATPase [Streptomyces sp. MN13]
MVDPIPPLSPELLERLEQFAAVEAGGALRFISRAGGAIELDQLHRFRVPGEADASLILRDGENNRAVFDWYRDKGRIVAGPYDATCDMVFTAWAGDLGKGLTSLMTAADTATVTALNLRAQAWHIEAGTVDTRQGAALRAGQRAHVGDIIVTRLNRRRRTVRGGRDFVKNGDTWTISKIPSGRGRGGPPHPAPRPHPPARPLPGLPSANSATPPPSTAPGA